MTGIAVVGKISLIIHHTQNVFPGTSISAIASAASVLFTILFILCDYQDIKFILFLNTSDQKIIYLPWEPPPAMFANKASQNTNSLESAILFFFNVRTISSLFILLTNLFAFLALSMVGLLVFHSKVAAFKEDIWPCLCSQSVELSYQSMETMFLCFIK